MAHLLARQTRPRRQTAAFVLYIVALRPDPLLTAQRLAKDAAASLSAPVVVPDRPTVARFAIFSPA